MLFIIFNVLLNSLSRLTLVRGNSPDHGDGLWIRGLTNFPAKSKVGLSLPGLTLYPALNENNYYKTYQAKAAFAVLSPLVADRQDCDQYKFSPTPEFISCVKLPRRER